MCGDVYYTRQVRRIYCFHFCVSVCVCVCPRTQSIGLNGRNDVLFAEKCIRLVCEKLTIFPYRQDIVGNVILLAFWRFSQVQDRSGVKEKCTKNVCPILKKFCMVVHIGLRTSTAVQKFIFQKSNMGTAPILKNVINAISLQSNDLFWWNLVR